jgi:hypothetical protein
MSINAPCQPECQPGDEAASARDPRILLGADVHQVCLEVPYCLKIPVEVVLSRTPAGGGELFLISRVRTRICCLNSPGTSNAQVEEAGTHHL